MRPLKFAIFGLSITSSWGNGHAVTWRSLVRGLRLLGHDIDFFERNQPWYVEHRDLPDPDDVNLILYDERAEIEHDHLKNILDADVILFSSYVPENIALSKVVLDNATCPVGFYDIDTPLTIARLERGDHEYLTPELIRRFDIYLSFAGGPILDRLEREFGSPCARALYCSVNGDVYRPLADEPLAWDMAYLGTYSPDRQPGVERLMLEPARRMADARFAVAGPQYPGDTRWPANLERIEHLPPSEHTRFYNRQRFTLNITRADMRRAGWSPSVRLFEAAACGTPIISDDWPGLETLFDPKHEILIPQSGEAVMQWLSGMPDSERRAIGRAARERVLAQHTSRQRATGLIADLCDAAALRGHSWADGTDGRTGADAVSAPTH